MRRTRQALGPPIQLRRSVGILVERIEALETLLATGDATAWEPYLATLNCLTAVLPCVEPRRPRRAVDNKADGRTSRHCAQDPLEAQGCWRRETHPSAAGQANPLKGR